ncbi:MAG TPA: DnaJ C-terminal domain-containing protein, partial [Thermomicrobiales bacterium]|nr:DnaJ C-terminal domain-containing protein [Thermomicrobiales bacterium]
GLGSYGGPNGDVYLMISVRDDPNFERIGDDIKTTVRVPLLTAVLGGETVVPTLDGRVALTIPPGTQNEKVFRLRGKGLPKSGKGASGQGDLLATVHVDLPTDLSEEETKLFKQLRNLRQ